MEIKVNGKHQTVECVATIAELLDRLGIDNHNLAVEYNGDFLEADTLDRTALKEGDTLEIVRFVGGG